jgi:hypothetical protein
VENSTGNIVSTRISVHLSIERLPKKNIETTFAEIFFFLLSNEKFFPSSQSSRREVFFFFCFSVAPQSGKIKNQWKFREIEGFLFAKEFLFLPFFLSPINLENKYFPLYIIKPQLHLQHILARDEQGERFN